MTSLSDIEQFLDERIHGPVNPLLSDRLGQIPELIQALNLDSQVEQELLTQWPKFVEDDQWRTLLLRLGDFVELERRSTSQAIPIWDDLDTYGSSGRLLYFYVFALCWFDTERYLRQQGMPDDILAATRTALERHAETHRLKWGTVGIDAGWWILFLLGGHIVQIGNLQFHRYRIGEGTLSPSTWYSQDVQEQLGSGFRAGNEAFGIHIPARIDISVAALDATFQRARSILPAVWPSSAPRIFTCESWMMDDRLVEGLGVTSRIVGFQQRFTLLPTWSDDRDNVLEFVFRQPNTAFQDLVATSRLQQFVLDTLHNGPWRSRVGWLALD